MQELKGKVALVSGGGESVGRAIALALAARGVQILVTGPEERSVAETVGEIVYGGGKARHLAGDVRDPTHSASAVARAIELFGGLDIVVVNTCAPAPADAADGRVTLESGLLASYQTFHAALARMSGAGRLFVTSSARKDPASSATEAGVAALVRAMSPGLSSRKITCNAIVASSAEPEEVADLLLYLCSKAGQSVSGQSIELGAR